MKVRDQIRKEFADLIGLELGFEISNFEDSFNKLFENTMGGEELRQKYLEFFSKRYTELI